MSFQMTLPSGIPHDLLEYACLSTYRNLVIEELSDKAHND